MQNMLSMNKFDSLTNLSHKYGATTLRQNEILIDDTLEQLTPLDSVIAIIRFDRVSTAFELIC